MAHGVIAPALVLLVLAFSPFVNTLPREGTLGLVRDGIWVLTPRTRDAGTTCYLWLRKKGQRFHIEEEIQEFTTHNLSYHTSRRSTEFMAHGLPDTVREDMDFSRTMLHPPTFSIVVDRKWGRISYSDDPPTTRHCHRLHPMTRVLWMSPTRDSMVTNNAFIRASGLFGEYCIWKRVSD